MEEKTKENNTNSVLAGATKKPVDSKEKKTIDFDYIKSNQFRVVHADGIHGGVSPNGCFIQMAFFSERAPIPKRETFKLGADKLGDKVGTEQRDAVVREVEVEILMNISTAKSICKWMDEKIQQLEHIQTRLPKP